MSTKQSKGGQRRAEVLTPDQRRQIALAGARAAHSPERTAARLVQMWPDMTLDQKNGVIKILREGGIRLPVLTQSLDESLEEW